MLRFCVNATLCANVMWYPGTSDIGRDNREVNDNDSRMIWAPEALGRNGFLDSLGALRGRRKLDDACATEMPALTSITLRSSIPCRPAVL